MAMRRVIGALVVLAVVVLQSGLGVAAEADKTPPMVFDKEIGHYKDMSYEALSDEGLSWEQKTRIFGGETATYAELTRKQRKAKKKELEELLAKIDMKLVNKCEADIRAWLDEQVAKPLKKPGWEKDWKKDWSVYNRASMFPLAGQAVTFFRAYEMWGDEKYRKAGLRRSDIFVKAQLPEGPYRMSSKVFRIQDKFQDLPWSIIMYGYRHSGNKKYLESAKKCADVLLSVQRPDSGGWPDQWRFPGGHTGSSGVIYGTSHNDGATTAQFVMMVMMYHATGDKKYVANLHKLGPHLVQANLGVGDVVGWAEAYADGGAPQRVRQYEIEICYSHSLSRSMGFLLTWLYLMDGNEKHMDLMRRAYDTFERCRRKDLEPKNWKAWKTIIEAGKKASGPSQWFRPGWGHGLLPDGSNTGGVTRYAMYPVYPVTAEQREKWGRFIHKDTGGDLYEWAERARKGEVPPGKFAGAGGGNNMSQVRRALLEHKRGGYKGLLRYYTGPVKYTPDQYLQARVDAAKRVLDPRNVRLASLPDKGVRAVEECGHMLGMKIRWYGPKKTKWGKAYEDYIMQEGRHAAFYQWQLVYDAMIAQGRIDADTAARGGRGMESWVAAGTNLDSWDVIGQYDNHVVEVANHFDVPLGVNAPTISADPQFLKKASVELDCFETDGTIRYTLDGSEPTRESHKYRRPIILKKTATVKARFCHADGRKSEVVERAFTRVEPREHEGMTLLPWVRYDYYEGNWAALPDFAKLKPVASGTAYGLTLDKRRREEGFGFRFAGYLEVKAAGRYKFHLGSDDGSRLAVDGKVVVDNDGLHGFLERTGEVELKPGMHEVVITFFERGGDQRLAATYQGPGVPRGPIPLWCEKGKK